MATLKRKSRTPDLPSESVPLVQILIVDDSRTTLRVEVLNKLAKIQYQAIFVPTKADLVTFTAYRSASWSGH